jgi:hypothetical protein
MRMYIYTGSIQMLFFYTKNQEKGWIKYKEKLIVHCHGR